MSWIVFSIRWADDKISLKYVQPSLNSYYLKFSSTQINPFSLSKIIFIPTFTFLAKGYKCGQEFPLNSYGWVCMQVLNVIGLTFADGKTICPRQAWIVDAERMFHRNIET